MSLARSMSKFTTNIDFFTYIAKIISNIMIRISFIAKNSSSFRSTFLLGTNFYLFSLIFLIFFLFLLYFLYSAYLFFYNRAFLSHHCVADSIFGDIDSGTDKLTIFFLLYTFWDGHILHTMTSHRLLLLDYALLRNERSSAFGIGGTLSIMVNGLVFLPEYRWHALNFLFLLWQTSNSAPIFSESWSIDDRAYSFLEDAVEIALGIVHNINIIQMNVRGRYQCHRLLLEESLWGDWLHRNWQTILLIWTIIGPRQ